MTAGSTARMIISMLLSGLGAIYVAYLFWLFNRRRRRRSLMMDQAADSDDDDQVREQDRRASSDSPSKSSAAFDSNIVWTVVRPVVTQVIASALQDKITQNSFRSLCISVLASDKMKSQVAEVLSDVWRYPGVQQSLTDCAVAILTSPKVGHAVSAAVQNAAANDSVSDGIAKVLAKASGRATPGGIDVNGQMLSLSQVLSDEPLSPPRALRTWQSNASAVASSRGSDLPAPDSAAAQAGNRATSG
mmetsp:Transcript_110516/g.195672  ORF Transcript_110516/g.195672 Transcript_110516/m.195672 type:complete len:246 (+) Transcript_110516:47-784(+)